MRWPLVTGANDFVFPNLLMFLESAKRHMPDEKIYVCDFGLTAAQACYLDDKGILLPLPAKLKNFEHAWYRKASLNEYLTPLGVDGFVWLDCDMILMEDIRPELFSISEKMIEEGTHVSICQDAAGLTFQGFADLGLEKNADIQPFITLAAVMNCSMDSPYLNTGFFLVNGMDLPMLWGVMTRKQHEWLLFEQCSFNLLAHNGQWKVKLLDCREWNAHGPYLQDVLTKEAPYSSRIIHVTSQGDLHFNKQFEYEFEEKKMTGNLKLFLRDDLRKLLLDDFAAAVQNEGPALIKAGVLS